MRGPCILRVFGIEDYLNNRIARLYVILLYALTWYPPAIQVLKLFK